jgi:hypothetical protein
MAFKSPQRRFPGNVLLQSPPANIKLAWGVVLLPRERERERLAGKGWINFA